MNKADRFVAELEKAKIIRQETAEILEKIAEILIQLEAKKASSSSEFKQEIAELNSISKNLRKGVFRLLVLGNWKQGKSTILNTIIGVKILHTAVNPCTAVPTIVRYGEEKQVTIHFSDGKSSESMDFDGFKERYTFTSDEAKKLEEEGKEAFSDVEYAVIKYPSDILKKGVELIDTPGIDDIQSQNDLLQKYINNCHVILFVLSAIQPFTKAEQRYLENNIKDRGLTTFFAINRWDCIDVYSEDEDESVELKNKIRQTFQTNLLPYCESNSKNLYEKRIFELNSLAAFKARREKPAGSLEGTGFDNFFDSLSNFLIQEKIVEELQAVKSLVNRIYQKASDSQILVQLNNLETTYNRLFNQTFNSNHNTEIMVAKTKQSNINKSDKFRDDNQQSSKILTEQTNCSKIAKKLKSVTKLLNLEQDKDLIADINTLSDYASNPNLRISVFGSFNRGKSTLLNALLDKKILPSGLVPTTGTTIKIKYGTELKTRIILNDGTAINEPGTEALKSFTRLNSERQMRSDIVSVEVFVPHPWLKNGIELTDLPGTNDREEQNELVYDRLLSADLVIQVLDASQLMTLEEASNLQYWTINRGIKTVIFVVNFVNLLEEDDQKLVMQRARSLAKEFRGDFPKDIDNLYRVDALPALKARQKREPQAALDTGITNFESALRNIADILSNNIDRYRLPRITPICHQVKQSLEAQIQVLEADLEVVSSQRNQQLQKLDELKTNFQSVSNEFKKWISTNNGLNEYKFALSEALKKDNFSKWQKDFKVILESRIKPLNKNLEQTYEFCDQNKPEKLSISLPKIPEISLPTKPEEQEERTKRSVGIATGIGWVVLGPLGGAIAAGAAHYANEQNKKKQQELWSEYYSKLSNVYDNVAKKYLEQVQNIALAQLKQYQKEVDNLFDLSYVKESAEEVKETEKKDLLNELNNALTNL